MPEADVRRIKPLDKAVVNRIAAGEIIVAPANALKEMLENAIDANSSSVDIIAKDGGLKMLQITDNGSGINKDDLPILCERFTTSKISKFEDLENVSTYGFRGEALASISHIAHLTVTTMTKDSPCAWRATYSNGHMVPPKPGSSPDPQPVAGKQGTQILVEDLFYNVPSRLRAFRSPSDEYNKIVDVVGRYAIHCSTLAFSVKRFGDSSYTLSIGNNMTTADRIRTIYGASVSNELLPLSMAGIPSLGCESVTGLISNANYYSKKTIQPIFFINHRSVSCEPLKRALNQVFNTYLPKGGHPFMYLSLEIAPGMIDVNVHPTKREVRFLNEDEIIEKICDKVQETLQATDNSRTYVTQTILPATLSSKTNPTPTSSASQSLADTRTKRPYAYDMVRTNYNDQKITELFAKKQRRIVIDNDNPSEVCEINGLRYVLNGESPISEVKLTSIKELRRAVIDEYHPLMTEVIANHTFVGIVDADRRLAAIQHDVKLYIVDYAAFSYELFYQIGLAQFSNFGLVQLESTLPIVGLVEMAESWISGTTSSSSSSEIAENIRQDLVDNREMLQEYFSLRISPAGELCGFPLMMKGYMPDIGKLPLLIYGLGTNVSYENEKECFESILRQLAQFYTPSSESSTDYDSGTAETENQTTCSTSYSNKIEHCIFRALKQKLIGVESLVPRLVEIASLPGLYKVFERC